MDKRRAKRISIGFKVEIISEGSTYTGEIDNLSEDGACVLLFPTHIPVTFEEGKIYELTFHLFSEETINFRCKVVWSKKTPSHGLTNKVGMEIIDPDWEKSSIFI
jgi:hypothetical protein